MNDEKPTMSDDSNWEMRVQEMGQQMKFPPTPDIAGVVRQQLVHHSRVWRVAIYAKVAVVVLAIVLVILLTVPDIRAAAWDFFRIGSVTFDDTTATPNVGERLDSILDLPGESTLTAAHAQFDFVTPSILGEPDRVFIPARGLVVLVWAEPDITSLFVIESETLVKKYWTDDIHRVRVNGQAGAWLEGEHILQFPPDQEKPIEHMVTGNVLIWQTSDHITYRLEGSFTLEEALQLVESMP